MSAYSTIIAHCPQDPSVAAHVSMTLENLAEQLETFRDKGQAQAVSDLYNPLLEWEEAVQSINPSEGLEATVTITTDEVTWTIDLTEPEWYVDLRMSIFHGKLICSRREVSENDE